MLDYGISKTETFYMEKGKILGSYTNAFTSICTHYSSAYFFQENCGNAHLN